MPWHRYVPRQRVSEADGCGFDGDGTRCGLSRDHHVDRGGCPCHCCDHSRALLARILAVPCETCEGEKQIDMVTGWTREEEEITELSECPACDGTGRALHQFGAEIEAAVVEAVGREK